jgi:hypothetical protein
MRKVFFVMLLATALGFSTLSQADPPAKPGNSGLPACLAKVDQQEKKIADQQEKIENLQEKIKNLKAKLDAMKNYAPVARTGQTHTERLGDDGNLQKGVEWPFPRFTDKNDGTITDNLTKLVWLKDTNCFGTEDWYGALISSNTLKSGSCNLMDGSLEGDWRLPNRNELLSLADIEYPPPSVNGALPSGHPFLNLQTSEPYWTGSTSSYNSGSTAWSIFMSDGSVNQDHKGGIYNRVWPVRDSK